MKKYLWMLSAAVVIGTLGVHYNDIILGAGIAASS